MRRSASRRNVSIRQNIRPAPFRSAILKGLVRKVLDEVPAGEADIRVRVVGDAEMARWNRAVFGRSGTTNVIVFPEEESAAGSPARPAGDILVSAPTCMAQTGDWPGSPEGRLLYFIIHGLLHILGYGHEAGGSAARAMRRAEMRLYRAVADSPGAGR